MSNNLDVTQMLPLAIDSSAWFLHTERMNGLLAICCVATAAAVCGFWLRRQLSKLGTAPAQWTDVAVFLRLAALVVIAVAALDPRLGESRGEFARSSEQIVLLLDRSRSMRAEDAQPSRFGLAVSIAQEVVDRSPGAAIAIASFATDARIESPLSRDGRELSLRLQALDMGHDAQAGTALARGLRLAADCFAKPLAGRKRLIVLTDGEIHDDVSLPAIRLPRDAEVLFLGIGDPETGARIPLGADEGHGEPEGYFVYEGQIVWTKSRPEKLKELSQRLGGGYALVKSSSEAAQFLSGQRGRLPDSRRWQQLTMATPVYRWICCGALALLVAEWLLLAGNELPRLAIGPKRRAALAWLAAVFVCLCGGGAAPTTPREFARLYNEGVEAYRRAAWKQAEVNFRQAMMAGESQISRQARFNLANTDYELARRGGISGQEAKSLLTEAIELYHQCIANDHRPDDSRANLQIAYALLQRLENQDTVQEPSAVGQEKGRDSAPPAQDGREANGDEVGGSNQRNNEIRPVDSGSSAAQGGSSTDLGATAELTDSEVAQELQKIEAGASRRGTGKDKENGQQGAASNELPW